MEPKESNPSNDFKFDQVRLDCTKITTLEEVKLILDALDLHMSTSAKQFEKLKHLTQGE
jgi:hypothetical protein